MTIEPARGGAAPHKLLPRHLTPQQVRSTTFDRAPFGRRGFEELAVVGFQHRVADELGARDNAIAGLLAENRQLKHALREWHRQLVGYDAAELMSRAQQQVEAQIADAESFSREREEEAAQLYDEIVAEARQRAEDEFQRVFERRVDALATDGYERHDRHDEHERPELHDDREWLDRQRTYVDALERALDALAAQVDATRQAFALEVDRATSPSAREGSSTV